MANNQSVLIYVSRMTQTIIIFFTGNSILLAMPSHSSNIHLFSGRNIGKPPGIFRKNWEFILQQIDNCEVTKHCKTDK